MEHPGPAPATTDAPDVVVVGAACRDVDAADRRGWRLGGAVVYAALALARLGLRVGAVVGVDPHAARAPELDLLRLDGVDVHLVSLDRGAVFENVETPAGRAQRAFSGSDRVPAGGLPDGWRTARAWVLAPVADELGADWATLPAPDTFVALGWQGLLRTIVPGAAVARRAPHPSALLARADLVAVGADDLGPEVEIPTLGGLVHPGTAIALTRGSAGGLLFRAEDDGGMRAVRRYPSVPADPRDPTGAGDVFLAALVAARLGAGPAPHAVAASGEQGWPSWTPGPEDLRFAATVASLAIERVGLAGVPDASAVRRRLRERFIARG